MLLSGMVYFTDPNWGRQFPPRNPEAISWGSTSLSKSILPTTSNTSGRWFGHEIMCINQLSPDPRGTPQDKDNLVPLQDVDVPNLSTTCFWSLTWGQPKIRNEGGVEFASFPYKSIQNLPNCIMGVSQNFGTPPKKAWRFRKRLPFEEECPMLIIELLIEKNTCPWTWLLRYWWVTKSDRKPKVRWHGIFPISVKDFHQQYLRNNLNIYGRNPWRLLLGMKLTVFLFVFKGSEGWKLHKREKVDPCITCLLLAISKRLTCSLPVHFGKIPGISTVSSEVQGECHHFFYHK